MDVMESPIEKPQRHQKAFDSGKQEEHTLKTQVIIEQKTLKIICLAHGKGKAHDFRLLKISGVKFAELLKVLADKGYQGIAKIHELSETPIKKPRGGKLTSEQKKYNRKLNKLRVVVEHVHRRLKIFKILSYRYRNRQLISVSADNFFSSNNSFNTSNPKAESRNSLTVILRI